MSNPQSPYQEAALKNIAHAIRETDPKDTL